MAGQDHFLTRLRGVLVSLDDDAYAAVASKGLLRRARKEIEKGTEIAMRDVQENSATVAVGGDLVTLDISGPSGASCSCPATGTCHHIIAACLMLADQPAAEDEPQDDGIEDSPLDEVVASDEWLDLDLAKLEKWVGKPDFRKARALVADQLDSVAGTKIKFKTGVDCHLIAAAGLDGVITSAAPRLHPCYVAAAVLAYRSGKGVALPQVEVEHASEASCTVVLERIRNLLEECVELGLDHSASTALARFRTLAVQARAARLYRPGKELENCVTDLEWLLQRHASADSSRLFDRMARLYALAEALGNHKDSRPLALAGTARSHYSEAADLKLIGMGAYPWRTDSGYAGLTVHFWAPAEKVYYSWSDVRPEGSADEFTPRKRFDEESPWIGGGRLSQLSTSSFTLVNAHANDERRLGAREDTKVEDLLQNVVAETYPHAFTDWNEMKQSISESRVIGLRQMSPLDDLVLLQPSKWEKPEFDEIEQQLVIRLHDGNGEVIHLMLPFSPDTAATIRQLEKAKFQNKRTRLLAYRRHQPFPHVFPVALIHEEKGQWSFDHLLMAKPLENKTGLIKKLLHGRLPASFQPLKADLGEAMVPELTPTGQFLSPLDDLLMQLAGSGVHRRVEEAGWNAIIRQLESSGMSQLAMSAKQLASTDSPHPRELLICRYLHLLHLEAG